jgi:ribonuclease BN (tRNA processing enzyme)
VVECTFLEPCDELAAAQKKHMHWRHLRPVVEAWSECEFVLTHFSQRYRYEEVERFREQVPTNAVVWNNAR